MKNNTQLVDYCFKLYNAGARYWFGCFGQRASSSLWKVKKQQYPSQYKSSKDKQIKKDIEEGRIVTDCSGLIKGFMMTRDNGQIVYTPSYDLGANGYYNKAPEKGTIKTMPDIPGLAVWKEGHIGVYVGNGEVIEARGFDYGVQKYKLSDRPYKYWLKVPGLEYVSSNIPPQPIPEPAPVTPPTTEPSPVQTYKVKKGDTLSKIANGITDTSVTMATKAHLRNNNPLLICLASNDALSANLKNIATLMSRKNVYFTPMHQDDPVNKPHSLVAEFELVENSLQLALAGKQNPKIFI